MKFLKNNIFVTAPSDSIKSNGDKMRLNNAIKKFDMMNINVKLGKTVNMENEYTEEEYKFKASEVMDALLDDEIDVVISANGGETQINIAKYMDFEKLRNQNDMNRKIFQGFSDNAILTFLLATKCNWKTFYGPCFPTFGLENWDQTINDNVELLKGNIIEQTSQDFFETMSFKKVPGKELYGYNLDTESEIKELSDLKQFNVNGSLLGGCLDVLRDVVSSEFDNMNEYNKNHKNIIWFIENCAMQINELREVLEKMEENHWFDNVCCFMIGRGKITLDREFLEKQNNLLSEMLGKYNVPIIINCDFGHVRPFNMFVTGATATIKYYNNKYKIIYEDL